MATIDTETVSYAGHIVYKWILYVEIDGRERLFYLGEDLKFCERALGMPPEMVAAMVAEACGHERCNLALDECSEALAELILDHLGGVEALRDAEPWSLSVE